MRFNPTELTDFYLMRYDNLPGLKWALSRSGGDYGVAVRSLVRGQPKASSLLRNSYVGDPFFGVSRTQIAKLLDRGNQGTSAGSGVGRWVLLGLAGHLSDYREAILSAAGFSMFESVRRDLRSLESRREAWLHSSWAAAQREIEKRYSEDPWENLLADLGLNSIRKRKGGLGEEGEILLALVDGGVNRCHKALSHLTWPSGPAGIQLEPRDSQHRTASLSVAAGDLKGKIPGVAPGLSQAAFSSEYRSLKIGRQRFNLSHPAGAILHAMTWLDYGDILLIEQQGANKSLLEHGAAIYDLRRLATESGIIVIEPAGNGARSVDTRRPYSGAVVVGEAEKSAGKWRLFRTLCG